jgi:transcriptional regulator with XRE-family HTH domain
MGKVFPICQGTHSPGFGKEFPMVEKRPLPRQTLAKNLKALLAKSRITPPELARKAGVDRKTVTNWLNGKYDPQPDLVEAVAKVFGVSAWNLLSASFDPDNPNNEKLQRLIVLYGSADDDGKENILRIAEMAAKYKQ